MQDSEDRIININIEDEMKTAYIDYSMSVIVSRALPDVRDGFKPVHRRVLFAMNDMGNTYSNPTRKSAKAVGEVIAKYHPHGDSSVYMTIVRLAQSWSLRYPLVQGQGNFGSIDGDSPAAMRYTECRLSEIAGEMLRDIEKDTVDFQNNFDDTIQEPTVLPTRLPNLLINGASGIAVGMATNMAPHNLSECIDGCVAYIDSKGDIDVDGLMQYIKAPDFPTSGLIYGYDGVKEAFHTGRGRVVIRSRAEIEEHNNHERIVVTEIPYVVNKAEMVSHIAQLINEKRLDGIANITDESNRLGIRIVIDVKRDANANVVLNKLYKMTALQSSFSINNIALVKGRPELLNLKDLVREFVEHRHEVVVRRTRFDLKKAQERAHILEGLLIAVDNIDEVIRLIRESQSPQEAIEALMKRFDLTNIQARAIVDMRLRALTGLERDKLRAEYEELARLINELQEILASEEKQMQVVKDELLEIKEKYGDARRTEIVYASEDFNPEDFYADDQMIITLSHMGYIKRTPLSEFRAQGRGGVGSRGADTKSEDFVEFIYNASMHATLIFFTEQGKCYWLKVYQIPEGSRTGKGRAIQNLLNLDANNRVNAIVWVKNLTTDNHFVNTHYLVFCTKQGLVKKTPLEAYSRPRANGVIAIGLREGDQVVSVRLTNGRNELVIANRNGRAIRFSEDKIRPSGRPSMGVRGITLDQDGRDEVIGMVAIKHPDEETILVISEKGYGKRSHVEDYRVTNRGGKGVKTLNITEKTGNLVDIRSVTNDQGLMIINKSGVTIRLNVEELPVIGRATQGVRLINLEKRDDEIASVCGVANEDKIDETSKPSEQEDSKVADGEQEELFPQPEKEENIDETEE